MPKFEVTKTQKYTLIVEGKSADAVRQAAEDGELPDVDEWCWEGDDDHDVWEAGPKDEVDFTLSGPAVA